MISTTYQQETAEKTPAIATDWTSVKPFCILFYNNYSGWTEIADEVLRSSVDSDFFYGTEETGRRFWVI